uniref:Auxin response factor n=1 Tax=Rhizophora mucronata TaxID=61149 RepID=A0A2P2NH98_RHIMU
MGCHQLHSHFNILPFIIVLNSSFLPQVPLNVLTLRNQGNLSINLIGCFLCMKLDIQNSAEDVRREIICRKRQIRELFQVALREVHHHTTSLWQRYQWARTSMPELQTQRTRNRSTYVRST